MNECDDAAGLDPTDENILDGEIADEALEAAAQSEGRAVAPTQLFLTSVYSPGCACA